MAGVDGFEPPNAGIKIRSLTAWRYPNYWLRVMDSNHRPPGYEPDSLTSDVTRDKIGGDS